MLASADPLLEELLEELLIEEFLLEKLLLEELLLEELLLLALPAGVKPLTGAAVVELGKEVSLPPVAESADAATVAGAGRPALTTMSPNCSGELSRPRISIGN